MQNNLNTLKDEDLIKLYRDGNLDAEDTLLNRYKNVVKIKARAYFLIGAEGDDIVQEGMIGLYKAIRDFDIEKGITFSAFADVCITRHILTAIRTANRIKHTPLNGYVSIDKPVDEDDFESTLLNVIQLGKSLDPEEIYILDENKRELRELIFRDLSEFEKSVVDLFLDGASYIDIAHSLKTSKKAIDNALQRIKKKLSKIEFDN